MELGVIISLNDRLEESLAQLSDMGFATCQIKCWNLDMYTPKNAERVKDALARYGIRLSTLWCGWSGPSVWNFAEGPVTLGIVPEAYREIRKQELLRGSDFGTLLGVSQIATHTGFLPEDPNDPRYPAIVETLREVALRCCENGQRFLFETGQETPTTLIRVFHDIGTDNLGVNLDPANLILYGKANPADALGVLGKYVFDIHAKDGKYPTDGYALGKETVLGEGDVNFPLLIAKLKKLGYDGAITIEREISGEKQIADILTAKKRLEDWIAE